MQLVRISLDLILKTIILNSIVELNSGFRNNNGVNALTCLCSFDLWQMMAMRVFSSVPNPRMAFFNAFESAVGSKFWAGTTVGLP